MIEVNFSVAGIDFLTYVYELIPKISQNGIHIPIYLQNVHKYLPIYSSAASLLKM